MRLVLLSGGSGKRLWPLSNDSRSKQFLRVLENEKKEKVSMVQRVWGQLKDVSLADYSLVATSKSQVDMIKSQLGDSADLIIEPSRRDTFPAIALAASYLFSVKNIDLEEVITVLPVDPFVENRFFVKVKELEEVVKKSDADIALIGVVPTYPSSKYGYIVPKKSDSFEAFSYVNRFTEKPSEEEAEKLINEGALWNCGVFSFKLGYIINILKELGHGVEYNDLLDHYDQLPKISFDYEVVEKTEKIATLTYDGYWKDLGTWNTLTEEMASNHIGIGKLSDNCTNTHLINELDIPVTVLGISNAVIAASPDGILISNKEDSPKIKEIVSDFENRPMYEEKRWGWYKVLDHIKFDSGNEVLTKKIGIKAGRNLSYQYHNKRNEVWTIIKGEGVFALNGNMKVITTGDVIQINSLDYHAIKAITDIELIEVQNGTELTEEDVVRVLLNWNDIEEECYQLNKN
ncbi:sugar phosphate nucleotidyltransferase [Niallia taxi]|uniref:sugar phosphate nucleotidyltransferase n=1 Tax=Niallia taxi TaxID=2499688 RepID=UPI003D2BDF16